MDVFKSYYDSVMIGNVVIVLFSRTVRQLQNLVFKGPFSYLIGLTTSERTRISGSPLGMIPLPE